MKLNIKKELHARSRQELEKQLNEAKDTLRLMRFEHEQARVKNTSSISEKKNEIAVIGTIINEKSVVEELAKTKESKGGKNE